MIRALMISAVVSLVGAGALADDPDAASDEIQAVVSAAYSEVGYYVGAGIICDPMHADPTIVGMLNTPPKNSGYEVDFWSKVHDGAADATRGSLDCEKVRFWLAQRRHDLLGAID